MTAKSGLSLQMSTKLTIVIMINAIFIAQINDKSGEMNQLVMMRLVFLQS